MLPVAGYTGFSKPGKNRQLKGSRRTRLTHRVLRTRGQTALCASDRHAGLSTGKLGG
jgi:hypothetical protein